MLLRTAIGLAGTPMAPFTSEVLNDQERWDVVAYIISLHSSKEEIAKGRELFEANCVNCRTDFFKDQSKMSTLNTPLNLTMRRSVRM